MTPTVFMQMQGCPEGKTETLGACSEEPFCGSPDTYDANQSPSKVVSRRWRVNRQSFEIHLALAYIVRIALVSLAPLTLLMGS